MKLEDLFPPCVADPCAITPGVPPGHKHILPAQQEALDSAEKVLGLIGGYGSGKSVVASVIGHLLSLHVPANRGIVIRRTYPLLYDTELRLFLEVVQRSGVEVRTMDRDRGWPRRLIYPNDSEVLFRESSNPGRWLGPEYGWAIVGEASQEPKDTFDKLLGRVRLPQAAQYLKVILTSNPPPRTHWLVGLLGELSRAWGVVDPESGETTTYRLIRSKTRENPSLPRGYVSTLKASLSPSEVARVIEGEYGFAYEGKPVYSPPFDHGVHVGAFEPKRDPEGMLKPPMVRGWDFGYHAPAVTAHQMWVCGSRSLHWDILDEYLYRDLYAETLGTQVILASHTGFKGALWTDVGDAAGASLGDRGPGPIVLLSRPPYKLQFRYQKFPDINPGLDGVRSVLRRTCACKAPILRVHRRCVGVIEGLAGGYHYARERPGLEMNPKPVKDGYYDNIMDTLRYVYMLVYRLQSIQMRGEGDLGNQPSPKETWAQVEPDPWTHPFTAR